MEQDNGPQTTERSPDKVHRYCRLYSTLSKTVLPDGALFLAEQGQCFWLLDVFASHLLSTIDGEQEPFTCLEMTKQGDAALIVIDDGNGVGLPSQEIEYTDFPLETIKLYGCWSEDY